MRTLILCSALLILPTLATDEEKSKPPAGFFDIDSTRAAALIKKHPDMVILDIRTPKEFAEGHLKGAENLDYHARDFARRIGKLDRDKAYLVHCASGGRSGKSMKMFREADFSTIYHIEDGYRGWIRAKLPIVVPKPGTGKR